MRGVLRGWKNAVAYLPPEKLWSGARNKDCEPRVREGIVLLMSERLRQVSQEVSREDNVRTINLGWYASRITPRG